VETLVRTDVHFGVKSGSWRSIYTYIYLHKLVSTEDYEKHLRIDNKTLVSHTKAISLTVPKHDIRFTLITFAVKMMA